MSIRQKGIAARGRSRLADDISEKNDLATKEPAKLAEIKKIYLEWSEAMDADCRRRGLPPKMTAKSMN
jgi:hypothetical protein